MAGRERPTEFRQARLTGDPRWLAALHGLDPLDPRLLLAPPGSNAELIEPPREMSFGDEWIGRAAMVCWVRIATPDGRTDTRQVFFERDAVARSERPEELLQDAIQKRLGEADPQALFDQLVANLDRGGSILDLVLQPEDLPDGAWRAAWREFFGFLDRIRSIEAMSIDTPDGQEVLRQLVQAQWAGFRAGLRAGRHWREAELKEQLAEVYEIGVARDAALAEAGASTADKMAAKSERWREPARTLFEQIWDKEPGISTAALESRILHALEEERVQLREGFGELKRFLGKLRRAKRQAHALSTRDAKS